MGRDSFSGMGSRTRSQFHWRRESHCRGDLWTVQENRHPIGSVRYIIYPSVPEGSEVPGYFSSFISGSISCNEDGSFELKDVIQNCKCEILLTPDEGKEWAKQQWDVAATVCPEVSDVIDFRDLKVPEIR